ncbi:MAG: serine hydrolase domain-containing protein [Caldilineaceae bacterium]
MSIRSSYTVLGWLLVAMLLLSACRPVQPRDTPPADAGTATDQELAAQLDTLLTRLGQEGLFHGAVLVARSGNTVLHKGYGLADRERAIAHTPGTRFRIASITKQFTALAIMMLQEQGKLHVYDNVCQYLPECPTGWENMTIHHLLTHTSGIFDLRNWAYTGQKPEPSTSAQVIEDLMAQPLQFTPGTRFSYTNGGFMVAAYIVEQVAGQPYADFLQENIFEPLGMHDTGYANDATSLAVGYRNDTAAESLIDGSRPYGAAGLYSTVDDMYSYLRALESGRLVSQKSLDALTNGHMPMGADNGFFTPTYEQPSYYGYGWAVSTYKDHRMYGHDGWIEGYGGDIRRFPDDDITIILLMNLSEPYAATIGDQIVETMFANSAAQN